MCRTIFSRTNSLLLHASRSVFSLRGDGTFEIVSCPLFLLRDVVTHSSGLLYDLFSGVNKESAFIAKRSKFGVCENAFAARSFWNGLQNAVVIERNSVLLDTYYSVRTACACKEFVVSALLHCFCGAVGDRPLCRIV